MAPHVTNFLLGSFGIVAAILLIGGSVFLRGQQNRFRFELANKALDAGLPLPAAEPLWKPLHRQAQSILAVGVGLLIVGTAAWWLGSGVSRPADAAEPPEPATRVFDLGRPAPPPRPSAAMQAWESAQERVVVGQSAVGCGVMLTLLGLVRLNVARTERTNAPLPNAASPDAAAAGEPTEL